jgi:predicted nuclease with RNAse H fold
VSYLGLDLTSAPKRRTAAVVLDDGPQLIDRRMPKSDEDVVAFIRDHRPAVVAIDAPLGLPLGLCCLEESCSCSPVSEKKGRLCERELSRRGIPCYYTTKRAIIKKMVYRGIWLKDELTSLGYEVIEIYPYASKIYLFGSLPKKSTKEGRRALQERLYGLIAQIPHPDEELLSHDLLDAALAAYTAYLYAKGATQALGCAEESFIHIPPSPYDQT